MSDSNGHSVAGGEVPTLRLQQPDALRATGPILTNCRSSSVIVGTLGDKLVTLPDVMRTSHTMAVKGATRGFIMGAIVRTAARCGSDR